MKMSETQFEAQVYVRQLQETFTTSERLLTIGFAVAVADWALIVGYHQIRLLKATPVDAQVITKEFKSKLGVFGTPINGIPASTVPWEQGVAALTACSPNLHPDVCKIKFLQNAGVGVVGVSDLAKDPRRIRSRGPAKEPKILRLWTDDSQVLEIGEDPLARIRSRGPAKEPKILRLWTDDSQVLEIVVESG